MKSREKARGSATLAAIVSVTGGVMFVLVFANVVRYGAASQAVRSAAERAARCISPTDAACAAYQAQDADGERDWYRTRDVTYQSGWADRYLYTATAFNQLWSSPFAGYRIRHITKPDVQWDESAVPLKSHRVALNSFEHRSLHVRATTYRPKYEPNFPAFEEEAERSTDSSAPDAWIPLAVPRAAFRVLDAGSKTIRSGGQVEFVASASIPPGEATDRDSCAKGSICGVTKQSGGDDDWRKSAAVAIKAFAMVSSPGGGKVSWSSKNNGPGLSITIAGPNQPTVIRPLGGRILSSPLSQDPGYYNLWIRGPAKSHGGREEEQHSALEVPRGGSFTIRGSLQAEGAPVEAHVWFEYYYDEYVPVRCDTIHQLKKDENPDCAEIVKKACGLDTTPVEHSCEPVQEPLCIDADTAATDTFAIPVEGEAFCGPAIQAPLCSGPDWKPSQQPACDAALQNRRVCGWKVSDQQTLTFPVDSLPGRCEAQTVQRQTPCGDSQQDVLFRRDGNYGDAGACPGTARQIEASLRSVQELSALGVSASPLERAQFSWARPALETSRWTPLRSLDDAALLGDTSNFDIEPFNGTIETASPVLRRLDASWLPDAVAFGLPAGTQLSPTLTSESELLITGAYPFGDEPQIEISDRMPETVGPLRCDGTAGSSIEDRLRAYAARIVPALADPGIYLSTSHKFVDQTEIVEGDACSTSAPHVQVAPGLCGVVAHRRTVTETCKPGTYLGRFPMKEFPHGPAECASGESVCTNEPVLASILDRAAQPSIDTERARAEGYRELERAFPTVTNECAGSGCASLEIDSEDERTVTVTATYRLPLLFPLSAFFDGGALPVTHRVTEMREATAAGRFAP